MPRIARGLVDGFTYHILNRGNGKRTVFCKSKDYEVFLSLMQEAKERTPISIFAYCLMPNHFHLVVMPERGGDLSRWMQWLMTSHVRHYHGHYGTSGHIWQGRYKSFIVKQDGHLVSLIRYVEANPIRARLVSSAKEWVWSSHRFRIEGISCPLVDLLPVELPENWAEMVDEPLATCDIEKVRTSVSRQCPYGDPSWQKEICETYGLQMTIRPRGRPKKK